MPTHDLERFILSQRTYSIFVPLYFGLLLRTTDSNCQFKVMSLMCYHYTNPPYNETISPGFTYGLFPITCCRAQQSRDLNRVYRAVSYLPIVIATHLEVGSPFRETLSPSVSFIWATWRIRTADHLITNQKLYQLSEGGLLCRWRESNPHVITTLDPKSSASTSFATSANFFQYVKELLWWSWQDSNLWPTA